MFSDKFYDILGAETYEQNQCLVKEHRVAAIIKLFLEMHGYVTTDVAERVWYRGTRTAIICLSDDYNVCGADLSKSPSSWYNTDTLVITDNHITFVPNYQVIQLPSTYFGIFSYKPKNQYWDPTRRFNFSVNRCDTQRQQLLFELIRQSGSFEQWLEKDLVNFNGWNPTGPNETREDLANHFDTEWSGTRPACYNQVISCLPIKNHNMTFEQSQIGAWINLVIETYAGDVTHAFSEKTFRTLLTPAPWMLFTGRGGIGYLESLGFDVLTDVVQHNEYDHLYHAGKISKFIEIAIKNHSVISQLDAESIRTRCQAAAEHNQLLLQDMQQKWPVDLTSALLEIVKAIQ